MIVTVNGRSQELHRDTTLADLLDDLGVPAEGTAVALNGAVVPRNEHRKTALDDGDVVEVIRAVAGG